MENAELYSSANGMQKKDAKEILTEFRGKVNWGEEEARVLDVGCGSGDVTAEILLPLLPEERRLLLTSPIPLISMAYQEEGRVKPKNVMIVSEMNYDKREISGFRELIGLDLSLEMIQHARNIHSHPKMSFIQFDIAQQSDNLLEELASAVAASRSLDLQDVSREAQNIRILLNSRRVLDRPEIRLNKRKCPGYDVISSFYCLHWIPNQRLAMKNVYKLLKPGGEALLVFLAQSPIFILYRKLSGLPLWKRYMKDVDSFIPFYQDSEAPLENFLDILESTGFKILTSECREKSYAFDSFLSLRNAIKAVNPFLSRIPIDLQEEFVDECLRQIKILKLTEYKSNSLRVSYKLIIAHIRKPVSS